MIGIVLVQCRDALQNVHIYFSSLLEGIISPDDLILPLDARSI